VSPSTIKERQGALRHLVSEVPASVVAKTTGYSPGTAAAGAALAGTDGTHCAALKSFGTT
jgi:hypothetical protein